MALAALIVAWCFPPQLARQLRPLVLNNSQRLGDGHRAPWSASAPACRPPGLLGGKPNAAGALVTGRPAASLWGGRLVVVGPAPRPQDDQLGLLGGQDEQAHAAGAAAQGAGEGAGQINWRGPPAAPWGTLAKDRPTARAVPEPKTAGAGAGRRPRRRVPRTFSLRPLLLGWSPAAVLLAAHAANQENVQFAVEDNSQPDTFTFAYQPWPARPSTTRTTRRSTRRWPRTTPARTSSTPAVKRRRGRRTRPVSSKDVPPRRRSGPRGARAPGRAPRRPPARKNT
jgi:hypothetical protein